MQRTRLLGFAVATALAGNLLAQVPNDNCSSAIVVANGLNGPYTNIGATTSTPAWPCAAGGNDVWFLFIAGAAGTLTVDNCNVAAYDSCIEVLDGAAGCGSLVSLGCNDDTCSLQSSVTATLPGPGTYYIRVGGWNGATGSFSLNVNGPAGGGGGTVIATNTSLGQGCIRQFTSFYEYFSTNAIDLSNSSMSLLYNGAGYIALPGITTFVPPSAAATALTLGDDANTSVALTAAFPYAGGTTSSLSVCSNGYVSVNAAGNGTTYTPVVATMLAAANTGWWMWHDYNPSIAGSGQVKFEEVGGIAYLTWDGVYSYATTNPDTWQMQFDCATGNVHFVWGTVGGFGNGYLVGYSPGGASADPSNRDISATLPLTFMMDPVDVLPLNLAATSRPVTGSNWNLSVSNIPATGILGVDVFGVADPGLNDLFFLGAPGCGLRASLDYTNAWFVAGATHTYSLPIPNNPSLLNFHVYTTSSVFQVPTVNALGAITSNGMDGMVGNL